MGEYYEGWTEDLIDKLLNDDYFIQDKCFNGLSLNGNFYWDERLVIKYEEYVDWSSISGNISFKPSIEFLRKYKDKWNWEKWFIYNDPEHIIWNGHLITEFAYQILPYIRTSKNVDWNYEIIQKFSNELFIPHELKFLSYPPLRDISDNIYINWGNDLIFRFFDKIDWISASNNNKFPFTLQLLKKISNYYQTRTNKELRNSLSEIFCNLSCNNNLIWSIKLIDEFKSWWDWGILCSNDAIDWDVELIEYFKQYLVWDNLSKLKKIWTIEFLKTYENKLNWEILSENNSILWTTRMISEFQERINFWSLSLYGTFSIEVISFFSSKWTVKGVYKTIFLQFSDWPIEISEEITTGWDNLSMNKNIVWTDIFALYYFNEINWYYLAYFGNFLFSSDFIKKLPTHGKKFEPHHSTFYNIYEDKIYRMKNKYEVVDIQMKFIERNLSSKI